MTSSTVTAEAPDERARARGACATAWPGATGRWRRWGAAWTLGLCAASSAPWAAAADAEAGAEASRSAAAAASSATGTDAESGGRAVLVVVRGVTGAACGALEGAVREGLDGRARVLARPAPSCVEGAAPCEAACLRALGRTARAGWVVTVDVARVGGREAAAVEWLEAEEADDAEASDGALVSARDDGGLAAAVRAEVGRVARERLRAPGGGATDGDTTREGPAADEAFGDPFARPVESAPATRSDGPPLYKRWWFWVGVAAVLAGVTVALSQGDDGPAGAEVRLTGPDPTAALGGGPAPGGAAAGATP